MQRRWLNKKVIAVLVATIGVVTVFGGTLRTAQADDASHLRKDIKKTQAQLDKENKKYNQSNSNLQVTQTIINSTASKISATERKINKQEKKLKDLTDRIAFNKKILISYSQEMYFNDQEVSWVLDFGQQNFSQYFQNFDQLINTKEKVIAIMEEIKKDKEETEKTKEDLAQKKEEHRQLLITKQREKNGIVADIRKTQITITQLKAKMSKLRTALSSFLGKSFSMSDVIEAVKYADKKTGVRKEFLFAVLDKETDLGRYTGGCTYKNTRIRDKNPDDKSAFKTICKNLGYNYKKMKVSCALSYGYGGAMGVAQFMPTTWNKYKSGISSKTGDKPADPWDLKDGIMGMALYLKDKGGDRRSGEHTAAAAYYCGSRLSRTVCQNYANSVISWSKGYDDYF